MAIDNAVSVTLGGTQNVSAHTAKAASTSSPAGTVYIAYDSVAVANLTNFKHAVLAAIAQQIGGRLKDI